MKKNECQTAICLIFCLKECRRYVCYATDVHNYKHLKQFSWYKKYNILLLLRIITTCIEILNRYIFRNLVVRDCLL